MRSPRVLFTLSFCGLFVLSRLMGVHVHLSPHAHAHAGAVAIEAHHHELELVVASGLDNHHEAAHMASGTTDVSAAESPAGKLPSLTFAALVALLTLLIIPVTSRSVAPPRPRVPIPLRRPYLLPPSHAPPRSL